jgi:uncharacterized protein YbjT (DUF2867 family)
MVVGDLLDPVSIEKAMKDVDKMYLLNAVTPDVQDFSVGDRLIS